MVIEIGQKYAGIAGSLATGKYQQWLEINRPAVLLSMAQNQAVLINSAIAKMPAQPANGQPTHAPTRTAQPLHNFNAKL